MKTPSRAELESLSYEQLSDLAVELADEDEEIKKIRRYFFAEFWKRMPGEAMASDALSDGEFIGTRVDGEPILWAKVEGKMYALSDRCPHRGYPLHRNGRLDGYAITCAYHGGQFDIRTGSCVKHPTETAPCQRFEATIAADGTIACEAFSKKA
jgi:nitrite reductase/ring-hydroxylating ferredoxin subunit